MVFVESPRQGGLRVFVAYFALAISILNSYYWSLWPTSLPIDIRTATSPTIEPPSPSSLNVETTPTKPILFLHIHKSGGTEACAVMKHAMNVTDAAGRPISQNLKQPLLNLIGNCNTPFSSPNADVRLFAPLQTCRHLLPYVLDDNLKPRNNVVAIEVPFEDSMPCKGFRSFSIMRHPLTRLLSHMLAHRNWKEVQIFRYARDKTPCFPHYYMDGYPIVNSMVIRLLLGRERFIDTRPVDEEDLERAKKLVDEFDAFVPMEYLDHPDVQDLLNKTVPEYIRGQRKRARENKARRKNSYSPSDDFVKVVMEENKYDIMLYEYTLSKLGIEDEKNVTTVAQK